MLHTKVKQMMLFNKQKHIPHQARSYTICILKSIPSFLVRQHFKTNQGILNLFFITRNTSMIKTRNSMTEKGLQTSKIKKSGQRLRVHILILPLKCPQDILRCLLPLFYFQISLCKPLEAYKCQQIMSNDSKEWL